MSVEEKSKTFSSWIGLKVIFMKYFPWKIFITVIFKNFEYTRLLEFRMLKLLQHNTYVIIRLLHKYALQARKAEY